MSVLIEFGIFLTKRGTRTRPLRPTSGGNRSSQRAGISARLVTVVGDEILGRTSGRAPAERADGDRCHWLAVPEVHQFGRDGACARLPNASRREQTLGMHRVSPRAPSASQLALNRLDDVERRLAERLDALSYQLQRRPTISPGALMTWVAASACLASAATFIVVHLMR